MVFSTAALIGDTTNEETNKWKLVHYLNWLEAGLGVEVEKSEILIVNPSSSRETPGYSYYLKLTSLQLYIMMTKTTGCK